MKEKDPFKKARLDGILSALSEGKCGYDELKEAGRAAEHEAIEDIGEASEQRFFKFSGHVSFIKNVREATVYEDAYEAIDAWLEFQDCEKLPELPVQIKSSFKDVCEFKRNGKFKARNEMQIVINCGPSIAYNGYMTQLKREIGRVRSLINLKPKN